MRRRLPRSALPARRDPDDSRRQPRPSATSPGARAGALLCLRTEDLLEPATRRAALRRAWRHLGLGVASVDATGLATAEAKLPATREELGRRREPTEAREPLLAATRAELCALYAPLNRQLRDLLAADRTSCEGVGCDGFLWSEDCTAAEGV